MAKQLTLTILILLRKPTTEYCVFRIKNKHFLLLLNKLSNFKTRGRAHRYSRRTPGSRAD